jgi:hypothetical protein
MKLGAEPKKLGILAGLLVIAGLAYYVTSSDSPSASPSASTAPSRVPVHVEPVPPSGSGAAAPSRRNLNRSLIKEFKPSLGTRDPKDRPDPATIDPTLRLDLLAKVQNIEVGPPGRNLFQFGSAPPPPSALPKLPNPGKIVVNNPPPPPVVPSGPPPPPQAPPMTFKYYGYKVSKSDGHKAAFLLDGEDILIAGENDTVKKRYRVVKIGLNSITIEDTQFKSTQTLPLQENLTG